MLECEILIFLFSFSLVYRLKYCQSERQRERDEGNESSENAGFMIALSDSKASNYETVWKSNKKRIQSTFQTREYSRNTKIRVRQIFETVKFDVPTTRTMGISKILH